MVCVVLSPNQLGGVPLSVAESGRPGRNQWLAHKLTAPSSANCIGRSIDFQTSQCPEAHLLTTSAAVVHGLAPSAEKLAQAVEAEGNQNLKIVHIATDHSYSDKRIAMEEEVLGGLDFLKAQ